MAGVPSDMARYLISNPNTDLSDGEKKIQRGCSGRGIDGRMIATKKKKVKG